MCGSLPSLVTPIRVKDNLTWTLGSVFMLVYLFYCLLTLSATFRFQGLQDCCVQWCVPVCCQSVSIDRSLEMTENR